MTDARYLAGLRDDDVPVAVESTYDRTTRSYVTVMVDADGLQVGDALYDGTKADRDASVRQYRRIVASSTAAASDR